MIISIVWVKSNERIKRYNLQADLYAKALEKGQPVPDNWFIEPPKKSRSLKIGLICMAVGIGIMGTIGLAASIFISGGGNYMRDDVFIPFMLLGATGIIPFVIGIAFMGIFGIETYGIKTKSSVVKDAK
jgi:hypothetical protein